MSKIKFSRNKQWRKRQGHKIFMKQVLIESFGFRGSFFYSKPNSDGVRVPMTLEEIAKHPHLKKFRNVRTYCSCHYCKNKRYSRTMYNRETKLLKSCELQDLTE